MTMDLIRQFIESDFRPMGCRASAGTGKTFLITQLHQTLVKDHDFQPDQILVVTFSRNATQELKERIAEGATLPIFTIHGFCLWVLRHHGQSLGLPIGTDILTGFNNFEWILGTTQKMLLQLPEAELTELLSDQSLPVFSDWIANLVLNESEPWPLAEGSFDDLFAKFMDAHFRTDSLQAILTFLNQQRDGKTAFDSALQTLRVDIDELNRSAPEAVTCEWFREVRALLSRLPSIRDGRRDSEPGITYNRVRDFVKNLNPETFDSNHFLQVSQRQTKVREFLKKVRDTVTQEKIQSGLVGFNDLEALTLRALQENPDITQQLRERFPIILLDECQDTNSRQWALFSTILGEGLKGLFAVGDPKQCLYQFRGADPRIFKTMIESIQAQEGKVVSLIDHYRSIPSLLNSINRLSQFLFESDEAPLLTAKTPDMNGGIWKCVVSQSIAEDTAKLCRHLHQVMNIPWEDILVLPRNLRAHALSFREAFEKYNVPLFIDSGSEFYSHPAIRWIRHLFHWMTYRDSLSWFHLNHSPLFGSKGPHFELHELVEALSGLNLESDLQTIIHWPAFQNWEQEIQLWSQLRFALSELPFDRAASPLSLAVRFMDLAMEKGEAQRSPWGNPNAVQLMTVHASKGLQSPVVILPQMTERPFRAGQEKDLNLGGTFCLRGRGADGSSVDTLASLAFKDFCRNEQIFENRRLFYVAATRAKTHVFFLEEENETVPEESWLDLLQRSSIPIPTLALQELAPGNPGTPKILRNQLSRPKASRKLFTVTELSRKGSAASHSPISLNLEQRQQAIDRGIAVHAKLQWDRDWEQRFWGNQVDTNLMPFSYSSSQILREFYLSFPFQNLMLEGVIDCLWVNPSGLLVVDYKRSIPKSSLSMEHPYALQLNLYGLGLSKMPHRNGSNLHEDSIWCCCASTETGSIHLWKWNSSLIENLSSNFELNV